jgi:hypothetical protein
MFANWYEIYLHMKAREHALLSEAERRRLLASAALLRPRRYSLLRRMRIRTAQPAIRTAPPNSWVGAGTSPKQKKLSNPVTRGMSRLRLAAVVTPKTGSEE